MQAEEKDYFKLLAYNLFSYASNKTFKENYKKEYGLTDEQYTNQCKMFLTIIEHNSSFNNEECGKQGDSIIDADIFKDVLHSCIIGSLSKIDISNEYVMNYEMSKYAKNIVNAAKAITRELKNLND